MAAGKSATPEQNAKLRALANRLMQENYGGDQTAFAKALGVKQPTVHGFVVKGTKGAGSKTIEGLFRLDPAGASLAMGGKVDVTKLDTLAMAKIAAENLARAGEVDLDTAWLTMREISLKDPSIHRFYVAAELRLKDPGRTVPAPREEAAITDDSGPPRRRRT